MRKTILMFIVLMMFISCVTMPASQQKHTGKASKVGDLYSIPFAEIVVSVPSSENIKKYQNLHVGFSAIINADFEQDVYTGKLSSGNRYDVGDIVGKTNTRISAVTVTEILNQGFIGVTDFRSLKKMLESKAQATFDSIFSKWDYSSNYKVEIVINSLYLTDGSVGRLEGSPRHP